MYVDVYFWTVCLYGLLKFLANKPQKKEKVNGKDTLTQSNPTIHRFTYAV